MHSDMIDLRPFAALGRAEHGPFAAHHEPAGIDRGAVRLWNDVDAPATDPLALDGIHPGAQGGVALPAGTAAITKSHYGGNVPVDAD